MALRQGTFRKIPFQVESHDLSTGRRKQDHEFPQRDVSRAEDLGRKIRTFSLEMFVIGDDVEQQRDALLDALEKDGPGELIHPFLGRKIVQVGGISLSEDGKRRLAKFSVEFTETEDPKFPVEDVDALTVTIEKAAAVQENSKTAFVDVFSVANQPAHIVADASDKLKLIGTVLDAAVKKVTEPVAELTFAVSNFKAAVDDLINKPDELAQKIEDTFNAFTAEFEDDPSTNQKVMGNFVQSFEPFDPVISVTSSAQQNQDNNNAIYAIGRQQALAVQATAAAQSDFVSSNEAIKVRDTIVDELDKELETDNDDLFQSIKDLEASLAKSLPPQNLAALIEFTPQKTLPALLIVHDLFEDLEKEDELLDQNNIEHPGFVEGGKTLEVSGE